jgi:hypothetical protein
MSIEECSKDFWFQITNRKGEVFDCVVDAQDREIVESHRWRIIKARNTRYVVSGKHKLHRLILNPGDGIITDHKDRNGLNNRRNNLRPSTREENASNTEPYQRVNRKSKYKGVSIIDLPSGDGRWVRWTCSVSHNSKRVHRSCHTDEIEAARKYDEIIRKFKGPDAWTNFPIEDVGKNDQLP